MRLLPVLLCTVGGWIVPVAKADITHVDSQSGFYVNLHELTDAVQVTATLTNGAKYFVNTGSGNHPGFAFNLAGPAITAANISGISAPWTTSSFSSGPVVTNGPSMGTFDYFFTNPGNGANAKNSGPLVFTVNRTGITAADFDGNDMGNLFAADIMIGAGQTRLSAMSFGADTGLPAIGTPAISHVPEPSSIVLLLIVLTASCVLATKRANTSRS